MQQDNIAYITYHYSVVHWRKLDQWINLINEVDQKNITNSWSTAQYDLFIMCERYNEQNALSNRRSER